MSLEDTKAMSAEEIAAILDGRDDESALEPPRASELVPSTEGGEKPQPEAGDFEDDQEPEDRAPRPGSAPAPGQRPSESGPNPPDLETEGN